MLSKNPFRTVRASSLWRHTDLGGHLSGSSVLRRPSKWRDLQEFPSVARVNESALKTPSAIASHPDRFKPES